MAMRSLRRLTAPVSARCPCRFLSSSTPIYASLDARTSGKRAPRSPSTCKEGTVLKGVNVLKDGKDPVAQPDDFYPDWLWALSEPAAKQWTAEEKLSIKYLRFLTKEKIKANALAKRSR